MSPISHLAPRGRFPSRNSANIAARFGLSGIALAAMILTGCSSSKKLTQEQSCQERWTKLHAKYEKKKYVEVREQYSELITSCPASSFTEQAMFEYAELQFKLTDWIEAEAEFGSFLREFPASRTYGELANYRLAMASSKQVGIPQRDQSKTKEALLAFDQFLDDYPDSKYADSAKVEVEKLTGKLVAKQLQIAKLYTRMDEPLAAAIYYKNALKEFGSKVDQREINLKLAECYIELGQFDEADAYLAKFDGIAKDDPFRAKVKKAFHDLEKARAKLARDKKEEQEQGKRQEAL